MLLLKFKPVRTRNPFEQVFLFHFVHEFFSEAHSLLSGTPEREGGSQ